MGKTILITGGARSGKSGIAETMALSLGRPATYIATAEARDAEMEARIAAHRARRSDAWITRAEPLDLPGVLADTDGTGPRLVDCLTLWLSNHMLAGNDLDAVSAELESVLAAPRGPWFVVSNEVGMGIVPDNALARAFRDAAGLLNQWVAAAADEVYLAVSGLPLKVN